MAQGTLIRKETAVEFFRQQLATAMKSNNVSTSALVEYYLVNLLASALRTDRLVPREPGFAETPLALLYVRALESPGLLRLRSLRSLGDVSLFVSGFFADRLTRTRAGLRYYRRMGEFAYGRLGWEARAKGLGRQVFSELARRFVEFADLLQDISETSRLTSPKSIVDLYERWLQTGSQRAAALLAAQGITPLQPSGERLQ